MSAGWPIGDYRYSRRCTDKAHEVHPCLVPYGDLNFRAAALGDVRYWHKADIGCVASMSALEAKRTTVYGDLNFCHLFGSANLADL